MGVRTGTADLPLHTGRAPRWLFRRMVALARVILEAIVMEFGPQELFRRLADPYWFQALGAVLGFDWHSSGVTTTTTGALKEALRTLDLGVYAAGGKGGVSRKTPEMIRAVAEREGFDPAPLIRASRLAAKVDSAALQDRHTLYHHTLFFTPSGLWVVIQQGMNPEVRTARRYHWLSEKVRSFVEEPHSGIAAQRKEPEVLNLVARESKEAREAILHLAREEPPEKVVRDYRRILERHLEMPSRHALEAGDIRPEYLRKVLLSTYEQVPRDFEELLEVRGMGPGTLRALALVADVIYGARPSREDPALYSFAHGGKDGYPYPVHRRRYDRTVEVIEKALRLARLGRKEKLHALRRLSQLFEG